MDDDRTVRVLLIEDNLADADLIREMLDEAGDAAFALEHASRLSAGLERAAVGDIDLILLDLALPDSRGLATFGETHARAPQVPIVVLSGADDVRLAVEAVRRGAQDYLVKDQVNGHLLVRAVRYAIERARSEQERAWAEAERDHLWKQVQEQAQRMQQVVDTVPEGVLLLDTDHRVALANPLGKKELDTLAQATVGEVLTQLGDRPLIEFLTSPPKGLWHEVSAANRSFQVIAQPIENGPTPKGWVRAHLAVRGGSKGE